MPNHIITTVHLTSQFKKSFKKLPQHIQKKAVEKDLLFREQPHHPQLKTHQLVGKLSGYSAYSVDYHYRVLFRFINDHTAIYFNIGTHEIYR